tara:strand:- start:156 stop:368 length:213 start_codon:yes stop_codon:yes gene_type:complete
MLTCAIIVWLIHSDDWDGKEIRKTFFTKQECNKSIKNKELCIKIDKRFYLTYVEWKKDNCYLSEHKWIGQ